MQEESFTRLKTPLGYITCLVDDMPVRAAVTEVPNDRRCSDLDGRYRLTIPFQPDGRKHRISCAIEGYTPSGEDGIESGENLVSMGFHQGKCRLSIGIEADIDIYDYGCSYAKEGRVSYEILESTKTAEFVFGIAWMTCYNGMNGSQTWFGADPTLFGDLR